ncbi:MAG: hypothetical protein J6U21_11760 [Bacteroidales bacterium]|nr:hypothetical protein [Bacteroidales bacterium]
MKKTFIKFLPIVAAVLFATSCSKDSDGDGNIANPTTDQPIQEVVDNQTQEAVDNQPKMVTFSVTVDDNSISKASLYDGFLVQKFEPDDVLVIKDGNTELVELTNEVGTPTLFSGTFPEGTLKKGTTYDVVLKNESHGNTGSALTEVKDDAVALQVAFERYGYLTSELTYTGESAFITLVQNTAFIQVHQLPFYGAKLSITIGSETTNKYLNGDMILAVPNGAKLESTVLGINTTIDVLSGTHKVLYHIRSTESKPRNTPEHCVPGLFSVSPTKQVFFANGNLQYVVSSESFQFADEQSAFIGNNEGNTTMNSGIIDLFGWGMWINGQDPTKTSENEADYLPSVTSGDISAEDYKTTVYGSDAWYCLTDEEWNYLLDPFNKGTGRDNANGLNMLRTINGVNGRIILPDGCTEPIRAEWSVLEAAGAVFLPQAGRRKGTSVTTDLWNSSRYWESSVASDGTPYYMLDGVQGYTSDSKRNYGCAVRLVREAK